MLKEDDLARIEENISLILCELEIIFPLEFFDSMEHLHFHLAYEDLVDQCNIGGCIYLRGTKNVIMFYLNFIYHTSQLPSSYSFCRFMGISK